jgi:hypothetical protein
MGATAVALLMLLTSAVGAAPRTIFFDDFDRPDGPLDTRSWSDVTATIAAQRVCGDAHAIALYGQTITSNHVRVSYEFSAADPSGFESYVALQAGSATYIAGCDGGVGDGGRCTPKIARGWTDLVRGTGIPMVTGTPYRVQAEIDRGVVTLIIADEAGTVLGHASADTSEHFTEIGLTVGRHTDGQLTCADNFRIEDLGPATDER